MIFTPQPSIQTTQTAPESHKTSSFKDITSVFIDIISIIIFMLIFIFVTAPIFILFGMFVGFCGDFYIKLFEYISNKFKKFRK